MINIRASEDGYFRLGQGDLVPGPSPNGIAVGDNSLGYVNGYVRFVHPQSLLDLYDAGRIVGITLIVDKYVASGDAEANHAAVLFAHVDYGASITPADSVSPDLELGAGGLFATADTWSNAAGVEPFATSVTYQVSNDLDAGRGHSDFHLRPSGLVGSFTFWSIQDREGDLADGLAPRLVVEFTR